MRRALLAAMLVLAFPVTAAADEFNGPSGLIDDSAPTFTFSSDDPQVSFQCRVDNSSFEPCESPHTTAILAEGSHTFDLRPLDGAQNPGPVVTAAFIVDTVPPALTITSGPDDEQVIAQRTATFTFTGAEQGGALQCSVDQDSFVACTSPWTTKALADGGHVAYIRAADQAGNELITDATFTVAVPAPDTALTVTPDARTKDRSPAFGFTSPAAGVTFTCSLDGSAPAACTSPWSPAQQLAPGSHTFRVAAVDPLGTADPSPATFDFEVVNCTSTVTVGVVEAVADCFVQEGGRFVSDGPVRFNGITLHPLKGTRFAADPATRRISLQGVHIRIGSISVYRGALDWTVPQGPRVTLARVNMDTRQKAGALEGDSEAALDLEGDDDGNVKGFDLVGELLIELTQGKTEITGTVGLPNVFTDAEGKGLTGTVKLQADNTHGLRLDSIRITAPLAMVGRVEVHNLSVLFAGAANDDATPSCNYPSPGLRWEGTATKIVLPTPERTEIQNVGLGFADGGFNFGRGAVLFDGAGRKLGNDIRVKKIQFSICVGPPLKIEGRIAFNAVHDASGLNPMLRVPDAALTFTAGDPWKLRAEVPKADIVKAARTYKLSDAYLEYRSNGTASFGGKLAFSLDANGSVGNTSLESVASINASIDGWIQQKKFNANFGATACFTGKLTVQSVGIPFTDVCPGVQGVVSSVGIAICGSLTVGNNNLGSVGAGYVWGGALSFLAGRDLAPYRATMSAAVATAAGPERSVRLRRGLRTTALAVRGADAPPVVEVTGPGGERVVTPASSDGVVARGRFYAFQNTAQRTTYVVIGRPRGGDWRIRALPGSVVRDVRHADSLPRPVLRSRVTGAGRIRTLRWTLRPLAGQRVRFVERGGDTARTILVTASRRGTRRFRLADGRAGRRRIVAIVEQRGLPRTQRLVATVSAPAQLRVHAPARVRVQRDAGGLRISWRRAALARRYAVRVVVSDGRRLMFVQGRRARSLRVGGIEARDAATVRVVGLRSDNVAGRARTATLTRGRR